MPVISATPVASTITPVLVANPATVPPTTEYKSVAATDASFSVIPIMSVAAVVRVVEPSSRTLKSAIAFEVAIPVTTPSVNPAKSFRRATAPLSDNAISTSDLSVIVGVEAVAASSRAVSANTVPVIDVTELASTTDVVLEFVVFRWAASVAASATFNMATSIASIDEVPKSFVFAAKSVTAAVTFSVPAANLYAFT